MLNLYWKFTLLINFPLVIFLQKTSIYIISIFYFYFLGTTLQGSINKFHRTDEDVSEFNGPGHLQSYSFQCWFFNVILKLCQIQCIIPIVNTVYKIKFQISFNTYFAKKLIAWSDQKSQQVCTYFYVHEIFYLLQKTHSN